MAKPFHLAGAAILALVLCSAANAQRGGAAGGHIGAHAAAAPSRSFSSSFGPNTSFRGASAPTARRFSSGFTTQGAPGLGFDYPHLAAVGGNFRFNPPATGSRRGEFGRRKRGSFVPIIWGGIPYYYGDCWDIDECGPVDQSGYAYPPATPEAPAPQVIVIQQPVALAPAANPGAASQSDPQPQAAAPPPEKESQNTGFVLMRRDGQVLSASAYTVVGSNIRYITPEGVIRTIPLADLDMDTTRSMNEARGVSIPAAD